MSNRLAEKAVKIAKQIIETGEPIFDAELQQERDSAMEAIMKFSIKKKIRPPVLVDSCISILTKFLVDFAPTEESIEEHFRLVKQDVIEKWKKERGVN